LQAQILSGSSLLCNWLHFPQETGIHVENKASHRDILFTVGAGAVQRFWYGSWATISGGVRSQSWRICFESLWWCFTFSARLATQKQTAT